MTQPLVVIIMGSRADEAHCQKIAEAARVFGLEVSMRIASAHKTPAHALSGFVDGSVTAPVIACPPASESCGGADIFSSLRMPSGIAPAVVLEPANAALLAAKILGLVDSTVRDRVIEFQTKQADKIKKEDREMNP